MGGCCGKDKDSQYDPRNNGPIKNRSCTDILCLLFFLVVLIAYVIVGIFAWLNGNPLILVNPTDNQGRLCGVKYDDGVDLSSKPNLFFFDLTECAEPRFSLSFQCQTTQVCVASCPTEFWTYLIDFTALELQTSIVSNADKATAANVNWNKYICQYNYDVKTVFENGTGGATDLQTIIQNKHCAAYYVPSVPMLGRCIPDVASAAESFASGSETLVDYTGTTVTGTNLTGGSEIVRHYLNAQDIAIKILSDFSTSWQWIVGGIVIAAVLSFIWIILMRWITCPMVWISIFSIGGIIVFGIYYTYTEWQRLLTVDGSNSSLISVGLTTNLDQYLALQDTWLGFFVILCVVGGIYLLLIIFLRNRIRIAIEIIKVSSKAVSSMISTLFYPLLTFYFLVVVIVFWGATELFLASSGDPVYKAVYTGSGDTDKNNLHDTVCNAQEWLSKTHQYYNDADIKCSFIGYGGDSLFQQNRLWLQIGIVFIFFWLLNWVIALGQCTLAGAYASYYWAWEKPRDVPAFPLFAAFGRALRYHTGSLAFGSFLVALVQFIRAILEYLDQKLRGSAARAIKLIIANVVRVVVVDKVTDFVLFVGKMLIVASLVALSWAFFSNKISFSTTHVPSLNYYWMPIIVIGIGSYMVAAGFFNTFGMAVDTVFLCFLEDLERNDGSEEKPYYMSKGLMGVLGKKNKKPKKAKKED